MTILTSSSDGTNQFEQQELSYQPTTPLRSSTDEDSCNDDTLQLSSRSLLRVSNDGISLPVISLGGTTHSTTISTTSISLPISEHLEAALPFDDLIQEVKKEQKADSSSSSTAVIDIDDDGPTPLESTEEFKLVSANWNETLNQIIPEIDTNKAKKEFALLYHMSKKVFSDKNGYDRDMPSKLLNYDGRLINSHNRWSDIRPWSHNIVTLKTPIPVTESYYKDFPVSYVNASHIKLEGQNFISSSAPLPSSFDHYWQMIFEQGSDTIVMLTKLIENRRLKAHQYWLEEIGEPVEFGNVKVKLTKVQARKSTGEVTTNLKEASIVKRTFTLTCDGKCRTIRHFHYREWPDMGRPSSASEFITLMKEVNSQKISGPIVTHCSAGVGRAGTFIILYAYCKKILNDIRNSRLPVSYVLKNYNINVPVRVLKIRAQRPDMVQKADQYLFIKEVIATLVRAELEKQQTKKL